MENLKFGLFSIIVILGFVLLGYWAFATLEPGSYHINRERQEELERENTELKKEVEKLKSELRLLQEEEPIIPATNTPLPTTPVNENPAPTPEPSTTSKHQTLINELQKLIDDKVYMKEKSKGTRVGTVQTFLNLYFGTNKRVDNDYGKTTKADVAAFQKAVGLTADGEAGPATYQKMIDWLKKQ